VTHNARAGEAGFTLIELLVALTLVGFLATLILGGLRLAVQAWAKTDDRVADAGDLWAVQNVLRQAIAAAYPRVTPTQASERAVAFEGEAETVVLIAPLPQAIAAGVPAWMRFNLVSDGSARALVMRWRLELPAAADGAPLPENQVRLLDRVRALHFEYFGAPDSGGAPMWQSVWLRRSRLPDLVRVRLEWDRLTSVQWPDLLIEVKAAMSSGCLSESPDLSCRRTP